jgi:hypothetical protein
MELTDYPQFDVGNVIPLFQQSIKYRREDLFSYRDVGIFKSTQTD